MSRTTITPIDQEVNFDISEMFFSKTDKRGMITAGNDIFARVSGYRLEDMMGQPHSLIRHPDMPKSVFKLFWDRIQNNQPIVAYVKNMASDGRYYWVTAMAFPIEEGYISIRLKPTSEMFKLVPALYKEVLQFELKNSAEKSLNFLSEKIIGLGFHNYEDFMIRVLISEITTRDQKLALVAKTLNVNEHSLPTEYRNLVSIHSYSTTCNRSFTKIFDGIKEILSKTSEFKARSNSVLADCKNLKYLAINMATDSERAGNEGFAIAVVSEKFRTWADEIQSGVNAFEEKMNAFQKLASSAEGTLGTSRLQIEIIDFFLQRTLSEAQNGNSLNDHEFMELKENLKTLSTLANQNISISKNCAQDLVSLFMHLNSALYNLRMSLSGMSVIHLSGKIESVRVNSSNVNFSTHIQGMLSFIDSVRSSLSYLENHSTDLIQRLKTMNTSVRLVGSELMRIENTANFQEANL